MHIRHPPAVILNRESATFALLINVASSCVVSAFFLIPGTNPNNTNTPVWQVLHDLYRSPHAGSCNHPSFLAAGLCSSPSCSRCQGSSSSSAGRWRRRRTNSLSSRFRYGCVSQHDCGIARHLAPHLSVYAHQAFARRPRRRARLAARWLGSHHWRAGRECQLIAWIGTMTSGLKSEPATVAKFLRPLLKFYRQ